MRKFQTREQFDLDMVKSDLQIHVLILKGGDPPTPSGTGTLLRLSPPYPPHLRPLPPLQVRPRTSGEDNSGDLTGGVYKTRERIQRSIADLRLLAIPPSCSRVADYNLNWGRIFGICSTSRYRCPLFRPL